MSRCHRVLRVALLALILGAAACGGTGPALDGEWLLVGVEEAGTGVPVLAGEPERLTIDGDSISGGTGCNSFFGQITFSGNEAEGDAQLSDVAVTEMACVEQGRMDFERRFVAILTGVDRYAVNGDTLTLAGPGGELRYETRVPPPPAALTDTAWVLDTIFAGSGDSGAASSPNNARGPATLTISTGGEGEFATVTFMSDDCGEFSIPLVVEQTDSPVGTISTPPNIRLAAPQCDDPASNLLAAHAGVLGAERWEIVENHLTFFSGDNPTARFTA